MTLTNSDAVGAADTDRQVRDATRQRDRLNRALRLLRAARDSAEAGDALPPVALLAERTGLANPGPLPRSTR